MPIFLENSLTLSCVDFVILMKSENINDLLKNTSYCYITRIDNKLINCDKKNTYWRPLPKFKKINITLTEKYNNEINSLLNKISPKTYDKILIKILDYFEINESNITNIVCLTINNIFSKAVIQPVYCPLYVKLINTINTKFNIKSILIQKCNDYKSSIMKENIKNDEAISDKEKYDIFCDNKDCIEIHYLNTCKKCSKKFCRKHMNHQCKKNKWFCFF